jgi:hypothetical protein
MYCDVDSFHLTNNNLLVVSHTPRCLFLLNNLVIADMLGAVMQSHMLNCNNISSLVKSFH